MKKLKLGICKFPNCKKETYSKKTLFCGEHERLYKEFKKNTKIVSGMAGTAALVFIAKNIAKKF